jgi:hypothetical protein
MININANLKPSVYKLVEEISKIRNKSISDTIDELLSEHLYQINKKDTNETEVVFDESKEVWKDVPGYEGLYQASNYGRIASIRYGFKIRSIVRNPTGYLQCAFRVDNKTKTFLVHVIVANTFLLKCEDCTQVDHINNVKTDNRADNLKWVTRSDNMKNNYYRGVTTVEKQGSKGKRIEILDLQDNSLGIFNSLKEATLEFDVSHGNLSSICNPYARLKTTFSKSKQIRIKARLL